MKRTFVDIELLDDAIFTARNATVGAPDSLDALPGATLLGAAAARGYDTWDQAFRVFQLGAVSFGDGAPLVEVERASHLALPMPLSWHKEKARPGQAEVSVRDFSQVNRPEGQWNQQRGGFVIRVSGSAWQEVDLGRNASMRTAIDDVGRAREGFLYGFQAVPRGTRYRAVVSGDDPALVDRAVALLAEAPFRVGRSRNAEFGLAKVIGTGVASVHQPATKGRGGVRILLTSDLALFDATTSAPRLVPTGADFGLGDVKLDLARSFLRTRRYSPFHGVRQRFDTERQVVTAGSVLTFPADRVVLHDLQARCDAGIGAYTGAGLGRGLVEPAVLQADGGSEPGLVRLLDTRLKSSHTPVASTERPPDADLYDWMTRSAAAQASERDDWRIARDAAAKWKKHGIPKAQWGQIRAIAAMINRQDQKEARSTLKAELERHFQGVTVEIWGKKQAEEFREWSSQHSPRQVALLARLVPREMAKNDAPAVEERR